jgi:hypothetical protein
MSTERAAIKARKEGKRVGETERELTGIGHGDLIDLIGVEPHLLLAALEDAGRQALLKLQGNHG